MEYRLLGKTSLKVSALALGTMNFGSDWHGVGALDDAAAGDLIDIALDSGVNLIDTADVYGRGAAESMLGRLLGARRKKILLATKVCGEMRPGDPSSGGLSRRHIEEAIDDSLRRLKTDYVDLYMAHAPDPDAPLEETLEAFDRVVRSGKARVVGCSNFSGLEVRESLALAKFREWTRFEFDQVQYSLASRFIEGDLVPVCEKEEVGILAWSPLGGGFLAASKTPGRRARSNAFPALPEKRLAGLVRVLEQVAALEKLAPAQAALGWILAKPYIASAVIGARTPEQLRENLASRPLSTRSVSFLDRASGLCLSPA